MGESSLQTRNCHWMRGFFTPFQLAPNDLLRGFWLGFKYSYSKEGCENEQCHSIEASPFAILIVQLRSWPAYEREEYLPSNQLMGSVASIGPNTKEAGGGNREKSSVRKCRSPIKRPKKLFFGRNCSRKQTIQVWNNLPVSSASVKNCSSSWLRF